MVGEHEVTTKPGEFKVEVLQGKQPNTVGKVYESIFVGITDENGEVGWLVISEDAFDVLKDATKPLPITVNVSKVAPNLPYSPRITISSIAITNGKKQLEF